MPILNTEHLLLNFLNHDEYTVNSQREFIIQPIANYFQKPNPSLVQIQLLSHGLFHPEQTDKAYIRKWLEKDYKLKVTQVFNQLKQAWDGPEVNIFILPFNLNDHSSITGSGLSFTDKILLFLSLEPEKHLIETIMTHEYSHVLRLQTIHHEEVIQLKDAIIMEGIAEVITRRKYGKSLLPNITPDILTIENLYKQWILPNLEIRSTHPLYQHLMYGNESMPQYLGYYIGTYLVERWQKSYLVSDNQLIRQPTNDFF